MRLIRIFSLFIFFPLTLSCLAEGSPSTSIQTCAKISDDSARLACYDKLAREMLPAVQTKASSADKDAQKTQAQAMASSNATDVIQSEVPQIVSTPPAKTPIAQPGVETLEAEFGKPSQPTEIESIQAAIVGEFHGWVKGAIISLNNGQQWRVVSGTKGYARLKDPQVVIEKGIFDSYSMHVDGFIPLAKVRRVK